MGLQQEQGVVFFFQMWIVADGSIIVQRRALKTDHNYQQITELYFCHLGMNLIFSPYRQDNISAAWTHHIQQYFTDLNIMLLVFTSPRFLLPLLLSLLLLFFFSFFSPFSRWLSAALTLSCLRGPGFYLNQSISGLTPAPRLNRVVQRSHTLTCAGVHSHTSQGETMTLRMLSSLQIL